MAVTEYIGPLVGPVFADPAEWTSTQSYEALTVVLHEGNSYTARQDVPAGVQITNEKYWLETGNYNAQLEAYRKETLAALSSFNQIRDYTFLIYATVADIKAADLPVGANVISLQYSTDLPSAQMQWKVQDATSELGIGSFQLDNGNVAVMNPMTDSDPYSIGAPLNADSTDYWTAILKHVNVKCVSSDNPYYINGHVQIDADRIIDLNGCTIYAQGANIENYEIFRYKATCKSLQLLNGIITGTNRYNTSYVNGIYATSNLIPLYGTEGACDITIDNMTFNNVWCAAKSDYGLNSDTAVTWSNIKISNSSVLESYGVINAAYAEIRATNITMTPYESSVATGTGHAFYSYGNGNIYVYNSNINCSGTGYQGLINKRVHAGTIEIYNSILQCNCLIYTERYTQMKVVNCTITNVASRDNLSLFAIHTTDSTFTISNCNITSDVPIATKYPDNTRNLEFFLTNNNIVINKALFINWASNQEPTTWHISNNIVAIDLDGTNSPAGYVIFRDSQASIIAINNNFNCSNPSANQCIFWCNYHPDQVEDGPTIQSKYNTYNSYGIAANANSSIKKAEFIFDNNTQSRINSYVNQTVENLTIAACTNNGTFTAQGN